jgi:hypothetical protein
MAKLHFHVAVTAVPGVSVARMKAFIEDAVSAWGGQFEPRDGGYPASTPGSGDPLGPPCALGRRGAVKVTQLRMNRLRWRTPK